MVLHLRRDLLPIERHSLSSRSKIGQEAADFHRDAESRGMDGRNKLPLPPLRPRPTALGVLPGEPRLDRAPRTLQRSHRSGGKRPRRPLRLTPTLPPPLGNPGAHRPHTDDLRLARRADKLPHKHRIPDLAPSPLNLLLASGHTGHRQGHPPFPRNILARLPPRPQPPPAAPHPNTRTLDHEPPQNEQEHRQRRQPLLRAARIRRGRPALLPPPRRWHHRRQRLRRAQRDHQLQEGLCRRSGKPSRPHTRAEVRPSKSRQAQRRIQPTIRTPPGSPSALQPPAGNPTPSSGKNERLASKPGIERYHERSLRSSIPPPPPPIRFPASKQLIN